MRLKELPVGARVRDSVSPRVFLVADQEHPGYHGTLLLCDHIVRQICYDAREPNNPKRDPGNYIDIRGNNNYITSNLHQWLNAGGTDWFTPQHPYDAPPSAENTYCGENPYDRAPGFLSEFSQDFRDALVTVELPCSVKQPQGSVCLEYHPARVFVPSLAEVGGCQADDLEDGKRFPLFDDWRLLRACLSKEAAEEGDWKPVHHFTQVFPGACFWYWLRTPHENISCLVRLVTGGGMIQYTYANNARLGVRPALNLDGNCMVTDSPDEDGVYHLTYGRDER